jgi:hypothetical protein
MPGVCSVFPVWTVSISMVAVGFTRLAVIGGRGGGVAVGVADQPVDQLAGRLETPPLDFAERPDVGRRVEQRRPRLFSGPVLTPLAHWHSSILDRRGGNIPGRGVLRTIRLGHARHLNVGGWDCERANHEQRASLAANRRSIIGGPKER